MKMDKKVKSILALALVLALASGAYHYSQIESITYTYFDNNQTVIVYINDEPFLKGAQTYLNKDITTFEEIIDFTPYIDLTLTEEDLKWTYKQVLGTGNITSLDILFKHQSEDEFKEFTGTTLIANNTYQIKTIATKKAELGTFAIHLAPIIKGIEISELTWWNGLWDNKREIKINNTGGGALSYYQVYVNLSGTPINETSLRVVNETAATTVPHWCENVTGGFCYDVWFNMSNIPAASWVNGTHYIYYTNPSATSASNGTNTFVFFDDFENIITTAWIADNNASYLSIPTYEGSNQPIHPDVIHFDTAWNGYTYWMCFTPYPNGNDAYENPSIVASNDGYNWEVPPGLTNPLYTPSVGYCNDPNLVYDEVSDELWIYWSHSNAPGHLTYRMNSTDGSNWTNRITVSGLQEGGTVAVIKEGDTYYMWEGYVTGEFRPPLSHSTNGLNWTYDGMITFTIPSGVTKIWHSNVFAHNNKYIGLFTMLMDAGGYHLYYAESTDKLNWTIQDYPLLTPGAGGNWDDNYIYQTAGEFSSDGNTLYLWYTGQDGTAWHIGYTEATYQAIIGGAREDWTTIQETVEYDSTAQYWGGSHSMYISASELSPRTQASYTHSDDIAIRFRFRKTITDAGYPLLHGGDGYCVVAKTIGTDINYYYDGGWHDTGYDITSATWHLFEFNNFDWTAHTYSIVFDGTTIASSVGMHIYDVYDDKIRFDNGVSGAEYFDNVIVRKYSSPEPTAQLGTEESAPYNYLYPGTNEWIIINNWSSADQTFLQIDNNLTNDTSHTYYNGTEWLSYIPGYDFNKNEIIPKNESELIFFDTTTTVACEVSLNDITIIGGRWHYIFLPDYTPKTLSTILTSMTSDGGDIWELYAWDNSTQSYTTTGSHTVNPNEGLVVYSNNTFTWTN